MKKNNFKSLMQAAVLICTPLVIASCDDVFGDVDNPISSYMSVKKDGVTLWLKATCPDSAFYTRTANAATGAEIVYSSTNEEVATVDAKTGKITAVGEGQCKIIVAATGKDSNGRMTYQEAQDSFPVTVKDWRCRVDLIEDAEIPVFNSADANLPANQNLDFSEFVKAWPEDVTLTYAEVPDDNQQLSGVVNINNGAISLSGKSGTAKITASIAQADVPDGYEQASFPKNQKTKEFEITVKDGIAYIAGYDAQGQPIRKTMFEDNGDDKYTRFSDMTISGALTLKAGWYVADIQDLYNSIRVEGDVNIIVESPLNMHGYTILDQSAEKSYELNIISHYDNQYAPISNIKQIVDFKKVSVDRNVTFNNSGVDNFKSIETLNILGSNINNWHFGNIGTLDIAKASLNNSYFNEINTLNINNATQLDYTSFTDITGTLNITNKETLLVKNLDFTDVENLNLTKVTNVENNSWYSSSFAGDIGTLDVANSTFYYPQGGATYGAINLNKGSVVRAQEIVLKDGGAITLNDADFTAYGYNDNYAVKGNVVVNKGSFYASNSSYHAVKGSLSGTTFYESSVGGNNPDNWSAITGTSSQEPYVKGEKE